MAGILTLHSDLSLDVLRTHLRFATARTKSDPNAASYVAGFTAFLTQWTAADAAEMANEDAVTDALAAAVAADAQLDELADAVNLAINGAKKPSSSNPQQKLYFGSTAPSKFKQPILGSQLKNMQPWPTLLGQSTVPALKALAAQATTAIANGTAAATAVSAAQTAREAWNTGGPREALFAAFNALCATAHGGLKAFALANPNLGLPTDYAESFFLHTAPSPYGSTVTEAAAALASAQKKVAVAQKHHDTLAAKEATRASELTAKEKAKAALVTAKAATKAAKKAEKAAADAATKKVRK
jgi:hypothetical protein